MFARTAATFDSAVPTAQVSQPPTVESRKQPYTTDPALLLRQLARSLPSRPGERDWAGGECQPAARLENCSVLPWPRLQNHSCASILLTRAGLPATTANDGTSLVPTIP